ncbi:MAG: methylated-DNA-protein-cysteine methyltransferase-like protein [Candidatus Azotimanducaceae bacterium]|jgi:methylated-DNA-protein-cysteine methyltransferase-like protein
MPESLEKMKEQVWQIVYAIPNGKVATYGQIARLAGMPQQSRLVGRILSRLPQDSKLPWYRVINSQGKISNPNPERQKEKLAAEGVDALKGRVSLKLYQWQTE